MSTPRCRIIDCRNKRAYPNGLCKLHSGRWYKAGRPNLDVWDGIVPHTVHRTRAADTCVICGGSLLGRRAHAVVCSNPECRLERNRQTSRSYQRRHKLTLRPSDLSLRSSGGQVDWPVVIQRIAERAGPESAALALVSLNAHRRRRGLPEVRL